MLNEHVKTKKKKKKQIKKIFAVTPRNSLGRVSVMWVHLILYHGQESYFALKEYNFYQLLSMHNTRFALVLAHLKMRNNNACYEG